MNSAYVLIVVVFLISEGKWSNNPTAPFFPDIVACENTKIRADAWLEKHHNVKKFVTYCLRLPE